MLRRILLASVSCLALLGGMALAETKVEVKKVHICCGACEGIIAKVLTGVDGVKGSGDKESKVITLIAADDKAAQKALDALAAKGFHGDTGNKDLKIKEDSGVKEGKVTTLIVKGAHNCCPACCKAIKEVVKKVDGVESEDAKPKGESFTVKGNFDAAALVKALNEAGFHVKVEK